MKKREINILMVILTLTLLFVMSSCGKGDKAPAWVKNLPENTDLMVYFVGKSERDSNYANYLEAEAGALSDILVQFALYRGASVESTFDDHNGGPPGGEYTKSVQVDNSKITINESSAGLYKQAGWMDKKGVLYLLYAYAPGGKSSPSPEIPSYFKKQKFDNDHLYFTSMAVASKNTTELAIQAEQSARMQVLLWFGASVTGDLSDKTSSSDFTSEDNQDDFKALITCRSAVNIQSLSLREEAKEVKKEKDGKYYYYGLYSIENTLGANISEYECFSYNLKYYKDYLSDSFDKQVNFNGNRFSHSRPYEALPEVTYHGLPNWLTELLEAYPAESIIQGVGTENNYSVEVQNIRCAIRAVSDISRQLNTRVQTSVTEFKDENGKYFYQEFTTRQDSSMNTLGMYKIFDLVTEDNTMWQIWQVEKGHRL
jgi:hypothetical protein